VQVFFTALLKGSTMSLTERHHANQINYFGEDQFFY
jgi:hypothetical protein